MTRRAHLRVKLVSEVWGYGRQKDGLVCTILQMQTGRYIRILDWSLEFIPLPIPILQLGLRILDLEDLGLWRYSESRLMGRPQRHQIVAPFQVLQVTIRAIGLMSLSVGRLIVERLFKVVNPGLLRSGLQVITKLQAPWSGELTWKTLSSIHLIRGTLNGSKLTFKEEEAIKPGGAHLNVVYTTRISSNGAKGTWVDQGDRSTGTVLISGS